MCDRVAENGWRPIDLIDAPPPSSMPSSLALPELDAMRFRVREVLGICHGGRPDLDYARALRRVELCGLDVGDKLLSRHFVAEVEMLAATAARVETASKLNTLSPSLGVPSDLALIWDGVSIGARNFSRNETLYLVGAVFMDWSRAAAPPEEATPTLTTSSFLVGPSAGQQHRGQDQATLMLKHLAEHPAALSQKVLQSRLAVVGSDGAATKGGPDSIHSSTKGSELLWDAVYPGLAPICDWDLFHRIDLGTTKAIADNKAALEVFDVARALGQLFGVGDGRVIYRAAAAAVGAKHIRVPDQGGTRKVVALARTVESLLRSLKSYQVCGARRLATTRTKGCAKKIKAPGPEHPKFEG